MEWLFSSDTKLITLYQINWPAPLQECDSLEGVELLW